MIEYKRGDILKEDVEALVNTVNCVGVMGRGIALQFKKAFPGNFKAYVEACKKKELRPGSVFVFPTERLCNPHFIINFPTKRHWRNKSRLEDIEAGLVDLVRIIEERDIRSVAIPPLGCGLGGLDWSTVRPRIEAAVQALTEVDIRLFEPEGAPLADAMVHSKKKPTMTAGRAALVGLMRRYLEGFLDPAITLLEVHKLLYFMQEAGEPLRLKYRKAPHGPYAENLRHVLNVIEGHFVSGYADGGDGPTKQLMLMAGAEKEAASFLQKHPETRARFEKVADLVEGFESSFGLELLSTVHWVMKDEPADATDTDILVRQVYGWSDHKRQFTPRQIGLAAETLSRKGWTAKA